MLPDLQNTTAVVCDKNSELKQLLDASSQDAPNAAALLDTYLAEYFPKAKGKLMLEEFKLLWAILQLSPEHLRLGLKYKHGVYELWMIYHYKDYGLLEKAAGFITAYECRMKATVNCIWVSEEKLSGLAPQRFIFTL